MSLQPEDWILFPDEVIKCKKSSVRNVPNPSATKSSLQHLEILNRQSSTAPAGNMNKKKATSHIHTSESRNPTQSFPISADQRGTTKNSVGTGSKDVARNPPNIKFPERFPTPDFSDIEDDFWLCCGPTETSE